MSASDLKKLAALLKKLRAQNDGESAEGATIDAREFLDGNEDEGSIGCNLSDHPGLGTFRKVVARIAARPDVSDLRVTISEDMGDEEFPFTDTIHVCTSADASAIAGEFAVLSPDTVERVTSGLNNLPKPKSGHHWLCVWWD